MSGLIGSCCEEQEAQEAAAHAKYRKAVRASESRLLARSNLAARLQRSLRCPHGDGCREPECNDCEEEGEECEETGDLSALALGDDDDDESSDEESALQRIGGGGRCASCEGAAVAAARKKEGFGAYAIVAGEALGPMLESGPPAVVHIASPDYTDDAGLLATLLTDAAPRYPAVRFVGVRANPDCMPFVRELPALLLVHNGVIESTAEQVATLREPARAAPTPRAARGAAARIGADRRRLRRRRRRGSSYCGRNGLQELPARARRVGVKNQQV